MDFKDASARLKAKKTTQDEQQKSQTKTHDYAESYHLRAKMIGVLLRDARLNVERTIEDCAYLLRVSPEEMLAWEFGDAVPSLPQLELLAYYLGVPISHFWGTDTLEAQQGRHVDIQLEYISLRNRMVGALLRQAREEQNLTLEAVSEGSHIPVENLNHYELGQLPIPMHELSVLAGIVNKNTNYFLESSGHVGEWLNTREEWKHFSSLRDEVRQFAANPRNIGFIEIAVMLSKMPTDQLRDVGASILDITR